METRIVDNAKINEKVYNEKIKNYSVKLQNIVIEPKCQSDIKIQAFLGNQKWAIARVLQKKARFNEFIKTLGNHLID